MPSISLCSGYVFTLWHKTRFFNIALDSKWNSLSHSYFCSLFSLLIWMYLFWFWKYIWTSHKNTFDTNYFNCKQGLEQTNVLKERVFMMFICFGFLDSPSKKLAAFRVIRTKAKSNSDNVFGHGTALLKISGHYLIEMSIFVVCWIWSFWRFSIPIYIIRGFHSMLKLWPYEMYRFQYEPGIGKCYENREFSDFLLHA